MGKYRYRPLFFSDIAQLERPVGTQCDNLRSVVETLLVSTQTKQKNLCSMFSKTVY